MKSQLSEKGPLSRPKDRSLAAYKDWITDTAQRLTTEKSVIKLTEGEWIVNWKEFWENEQKS